MPTQFSLIFAKVDSQFVLILNNFCNVLNKNIVKIDGILILIISGELGRNDFKQRT